MLPVGGLCLPASLTLGLATWCALAKACVQCEGCHVWAKAWELLFQIQSPNRRRLSSRLNRSGANLQSLRDMKKKSLFIVVSSWEWEDHYFIQADWFKLLVQKEICKKLMTECLEIQTDFPSKVPSSIKIQWFLKMGVFAKARCYWAVLFTH